jgi:hypothetical protein
MRGDRFQQLRGQLTARRHVTPEHAGDWKVVERDGDLAHRFRSARDCDCRHDEGATDVTSHLFFHWRRGATPGAN